MRCNTLDRSPAAILLLAVLVGSAAAQDNAAAPAPVAGAAMPIADAQLREPLPRPDPDILRASLPAAPAGFEWTAYRNAAFLKPLGWHSQSIDENPATHAFGVIAASPEEFSREKFFEHGFTLQIGSDANANYGAPADLLAQTIRRDYALKFRDGLLMSKSKATPIGKAYILRYRDATEGRTPVIVHKYFITNDHADVLYVATYESPEATWEPNWANYGEPILEQVIVVASLSARP
jgi:hypothetical protein